MSQKTVNVSEWTLEELKFLKGEAGHKSMDSLIKFLIAYYEKDKKIGKVGGRYENG